MSVSLSNCVIWEPQQVVILALSLASSPQKISNIQTTYRHLNCCRCLLQATRQCCCFSRVVPFIGQIPQLAERFEDTHIFTGIPDLRDSN